MGTPSRLLPVRDKSGDSKRQDFVVAIPEGPTWMLRQTEKTL